MNSFSDDELPPELLAGYADGELSPELAERVERWLAQHPDARDLLEDQLSLTRHNRDWVDEIAPPTPSVDAWERCRDGIQSGLRPKRLQTAWRPVMFMTTMAATLFLAVWSTNRQTIEPLILPWLVAEEDDESLVLANHDEIEIVSLPEAAVPLLIVGQKPWDDALVLAKSHELEFIGVGNDADGRFPDVPTDPTNENAPLLWAPQPP